MKIYTAIKEHKREFFGLLVLLLISSYLRLTQLGYSNFYGDETKTIYWNKTIPADQFLLNQRKGPVQFVAVWFMEKVTGGYDELFVRLPFAAASIAAVFILYAFLRRRYGVSTAFYGAFLFSVFGFYIAFGRTAQYQSFLVLFGLLSLLFADRVSESKKTFDLVLCGGFLSFAFLSHYDAIFFMFPIVYLLIKKANLNFKKLIPFFFSLLIPLVIFYFPYFLGKYYLDEQVVGYLRRRLTGSELSKSSSLYTFVTYNPNIIWVTFLYFTIRGFLKVSKEDKMFFLIWFLVPFILFELIFSQPGTHIHNYFLPLLILSAFAVSINKFHKYVFLFFLLIVMVSNSKVFIPKLNNGYPWTLPLAYSEDYQIFKYGFPYNRGWNEVGEYLKEEGVRSFYTNDNVTIGEWYLLGVPADLHTPHFYISVFNNQEGRKSYSEQIIDYQEITGSAESHKDYELVKEIFVDGTKTANIYKRFNYEK